MATSTVVEDVSKDLYVYVVMEGDRDDGTCMDVLGVFTSYDQAFEVLRLRVDDWVVGCKDKCQTFSDKEQESFLDHHFKKHFKCDENGEGNYEYGLELLMISRKRVIT